MTGEHKIGIAVTCTFLCLSGAVIGLKMQETPATPANPPEAETASIAPQKPVPQKGILNAEGALNRMSTKEDALKPPTHRDDKGATKEGLSSPTPARTPPPVLTPPPTSTGAPPEFKLDADPAKKMPWETGRKNPSPSEGENKLVRTSATQEKSEVADKGDNKGTKNKELQGATGIPSDNKGPAVVDNQKGSTANPGSTTKSKQDSPILMMGGFDGPSGTPPPPALKEKPGKPGSASSSPGPNPPVKPASPLAGTPAPSSAPGNMLSSTPPPPASGAVPPPDLAGMGLPLASPSPSPAAKAPTSPPSAPTAPPPSPAPIVGKPPALPAGPAPVTPLTAGPMSPLPTLNGTSDPKKVEGAKSSASPMLVDSKAKEPEAPKAAGPKPLDNSTFAPLSPAPAAIKPNDSIPSATAPAPVAPPATPAPAAPATKVKPPAEGTYFLPDPSSAASEGKTTGSRAIGAVPAPLTPPPLPAMTPADAARVKPIAAGTPTTPARPAPPAAPKVIVYDEQEYTCQANDTFQSISTKYYMSDKFADALRQHNQQHARASSRMTNDGKIAAGDKIYIPQAYVLEEHYGAAIVKPANPPAQGVPASFTPPPSSSSLPAPMSPPATSPGRLPGQ